MKVALATDDCKSMSFHGPRSGLFLVVYINNDGKVENVECRKVNAEHPHDEGHDSYEGHEKGPEHARWHLAVLETLKDVDIVMAMHMGPVLVEALRSLGKVVVLGVRVDDISDLGTALRDQGLLP